MTERKAPGILTVRWERVSVEPIGNAHTFLSICVGDWYYPDPSIGREVVWFGHCPRCWWGDHDCSLEQIDDHDEPRWWSVETPDLVTPVHEWLPDFDFSTAEPTFETLDEWAIPDEWMEELGLSSTFKATTI